MSENNKEAYIKNKHKYAIFQYLCDDSVMEFWLLMMPLSDLAEKKFEPGKENGGGGGERGAKLGFFLLCN